MRKKVKAKPRKREQPYKPVDVRGQAKAERHERFCLEYIKEKNGTQSAIAAGYAESGAAVEGSRLLRNPKIKKRIRVLLDEQAARVLMEGDDILREIQKLAKSDVRRLFNPKTGAMLPMDKWPDDVAVCVSSIDVQELFNKDGDLIGYIKKVRLWDKPKPQEMLGRNKKLFTDVTEHAGAIKVDVDDARVKNTVQKLEEDV